MLVRLIAIVVCACACEQAEMQEKERQQEYSGGEDVVGIYQRLHQQQKQSVAVRAC
jgi:hypothetical protein